MGKVLTVIILGLLLGSGRAQESLPDLPMKTAVGWIPIQPVTAGETLDLDLRRFFLALPGDAVRLVLPEKESQSYEALIDTNGPRMVVRVKPDALGLLDIPLQFFSGASKVKAAGASLGRLNLGTPGSYADTEKPILETVVTIQVLPRDGFTFKFRDNVRRVREVSLAGEFNNWDKVSHSLTRNNDGSFELFVSLPPGVHPYAFVVDGEWEEDRGNFDSELVEDRRVSIARVGLRDQTERPYVFADKTERNSVFFRVVEGGAPITGASAVLQAADGQTRKLAVEREGDLLKVDAGDTAAGSWIRVAVADERGNVSPPARAQVKVPYRFSWQDAIIYYTLIDRFANGETSNDRFVDDARIPAERNFQGGDLQGVMQKIEDGYFRDLGVNVLCFSPLHRNADGVVNDGDEVESWAAAYTGRWPVSHREVDERFGGESALNLTIQKARERGLFVMSEWEISRAHREHELGESIPGFLANTPGAPTDVAKIRLNDELAPRVLVEQALGFALKTKINGYFFRSAEAASHQFWWISRSIFNAASDLLGADTFNLLGDSEGAREKLDSYIGPNMLDGQIDKPLYNTMVSVFAAGTADAAALEYSLSAAEMIFGKETPMSHVLGGPDLPRFMSLAAKHNAVERMKMAMTMQMAIDGAPMLYYGDEIGLTGSAVPQNRSFMPWSGLDRDAESLRNHWSRLATLRRAHPALRYGSRRPLLVDGHRYAFVRAHLDDRVLVVWNMGAVVTKYRLKVQPELTDGMYKNFLGDGEIEVVEGEVRFSLPPMTSAVYVRAGAKLSRGDFSRGTASVRRVADRA